MLSEGFIQHKGRLNTEQTVQNLAAFINNDSEVWFFDRWAWATKKKLHLDPNRVNSYGRDFFFPAKAWPESSCRKTNCESEACTSAPGEVRTKIACSHMPACHWPFICINSRDLWAAQISASCLSRQVSQPSLLRLHLFASSLSCHLLCWAMKTGGTWGSFVTSGNILCLEGNPPLAG